MSWKTLERRVAKSFNTERTPLSGGNSKMTRSDTLSKNFFIEIKQRKKFALWTLWSETKKLAEKENKFPLLGMHEKGKKGFLIVVHSDMIDEFIKKYTEMKNET